MPKKKSRWSLKQISVGFNVLVAKLEMIFGKDHIPAKPTRTQRRKIKREVHTELVRIVKEEKKPASATLGTINEIAEKERKRAIRNGDYGVAIAAAIIQDIANQTEKGESLGQADWV